MLKSTLIKALVRPVIAACVLVACATAAQAREYSDDSMQPASVSVSYADLNLTTDSGAKTLKKRIARAAREVCGDYSFGPLDYVNYESDLCRREAQKTAWAALTTRYAALGLQLGDAVPELYATR